MDGRKIIESAGITREQIVAMKPIKKEKPEKPIPSNALTKSDVLKIVKALTDREYLPFGWPKWARKNGLEKTAVLAVIKEVQAVFNEPDAEQEAVE